MKAADDFDGRRSPMALHAVVEESATLCRRGEYWTLDYEGRTYVLKKRRGIDYLARLLAEPARDVHVLELATLDLDELSRERGERILDATAKTAYRVRLAVLEDAIARAEAIHDHVGAERARSERVAIAGELARALGVRGRDRTSTTAADRARAAVTLAIRRAIHAITAVEPELGGHLGVAVKTGMFCSYRADPRAALAWRIA